MQSLLSKSETGIYRLTLNRPEERNALDTPTLRLLLEQLEAVRGDSACRCLVLTGAGRSFCTGADVVEWAEMESQGRLETYGWTELAHEIMTLLAGLQVPTIAVINGVAVGAGLDLALCCDFRIAVENARFKAGYTSMAYSPDAGMSFHLPRLIGMQKTKEFLFFDHLWSADEAQQCGMVDATCTLEQLDAEVSAWAEPLAAGPTFAYGHIKQLLSQSHTNTLGQQLAEEQRAALECGRSQDGAEAIRASAENRSPEFKGR